MTAVRKAIVKIVLHLASFVVVIPSTTLAASNPQPDPSMQHATSEAQINPGALVTIIEYKISELTRIQNDILTAPGKLDADAISSMNSNYAFAIGRSKEQIETKLNRFRRDQINNQNPDQKSMKALVSESIDAVLKAKRMARDLANAPSTKKR
jgi:vesicle coat complex subunit